MSGLFRVEVLQHRRRDWLGSIQLNRPVPLTVLTCGVALVLMALAVFLSFGEYTRKARLAGCLVADPAGTGVLAHLVVPSRTVASLRVGQVVQLRYPAFGGQNVARAGGRIVQVSRSPSLPSVGQEELLPYGATVRLDRESVVAYGRVQRLVPGIRLEAEVFLERRRLIEWLFEPASGVANPG